MFGACVISNQLLVSLDRPCQSQKGEKKTSEVMRDLRRGDPLHHVPEHTYAGTEPYAATSSAVHPTSHTSGALRGNQPQPSRTNASDAASVWRRPASTSPGGNCDYACPIRDLGFLTKAELEARDCEHELGQCTQTSSELAERYAQAYARRCWDAALLSPEDIDNRVREGRMGDALT